MWLSEKTQNDQWDIKWGSSEIIINNHEILGIRHNGMNYKFEKRTRTVHIWPAENEQLSVWYQSYAECLENAKRIAARHEDSVQISMEEVMQ